MGPSGSEPARAGDRCRASQEGLGRAPSCRAVNSPPAASRNGRKDTGAQACPARGNTLLWLPRPPLPGARDGNSRAGVGGGEGESGVLVCPANYCGRGVGEGLVGTGIHSFKGKDAVNSGLLSGKMRRTRCKMGGRKAAASRAAWLCGNRPGRPGGRGGGRPCQRRDLCFPSSRLRVCPSVYPEQVWPGCSAMRHLELPAGSPHTVPSVLLQQPVLTG